MITEQAGQSSKSATIEMYAPSSYNDTMTGETLSSVSEKSETYSDGGEAVSEQGVDGPGMMHTLVGQVRSFFCDSYE